MPFDFTQYEIAGFNGSPLVACARALPVGYHKKEDYYFLADSTFQSSGIPKPHSILSLANFQEFEREKRITSLSRSFPMTSYAIILYVTPQHLESHSFWNEGRPFDSFQDISLD